MEGALIRRRFRLGDGERDSRGTDAAGIVVAEGLEGGRDDDGVTRGDTSLLLVGGKFGREEGLYICCGGGARRCGEGSSEFIGIPNGRGSRP